MAIDVEHGGIIIKDTPFLDALDALYKIVTKHNGVHGTALKGIADRYRNSEKISRSQHQQALKIVKRYHDQIVALPEYAQRINIMLSNAEKDELRMEQMAAIHKSVNSTGNVTYKD